MKNFSEHNFLMEFFLRFSRIYFDENQYLDIYYIWPFRTNFVDFILNINIYFNFKPVLKKIDIQQCNDNMKIIEKNFIRFAGVEKRRDKRKFRLTIHNSTVIDFVRQYWSFDFRSLNNRAESRNNYA